MGHCKRAIRCPLAVVHPPRPRWEPALLASLSQGRPGRSARDRRRPSCPGPCLERGAAGLTRRPLPLQKFLSRVEETFQCICCQELVFRPVTTVCQHNVCKVRAGAGAGPRLGSRTLPLPAPVGPCVCVPGNLDCRSLLPSSWAPIAPLPAPCPRCLPRARPSHPACLGRPHSVSPHPVTSRHSAPVLRVGLFCLEHSPAPRVPGVQRQGGSTGLSSGYDK